MNTTNHLDLRDRSSGRRILQAGLVVVAPACLAATIVFATTLAASGPANPTSEETQSAAWPPYSLGFLAGSAFGAVACIALSGVGLYLVTRRREGRPPKKPAVKQLGSYVLEKELRRGGMGQVHLASHALLGRPAAVKVMRPTGNEDTETALARFEREVRLCSRLSHPNTVTIFDYGRSGDGTFYYAMEFLAGGDLQRVVEKSGPLPPARVSNILLQVCGSLAEAHAMGIIHRDVKPSNVFLSHRGGVYDYVKVLDFGLAKRLDPEATAGLTRSGVVVGTPRYIAPETICGEGAVDGRADLYNLGAVAYWMIAGRPPFDAGSNVEVLIDHVRTPPVPLTEASELPVPDGLEQIVMKCLEKDPRDRFQSAAELAGAVEILGLAEQWTQRDAIDWWTLHFPFEDEAGQRMHRGRLEREEGIAVA